MILLAIEDVVSHTQVTMALILAGYAIGVRLLHVIVVARRDARADRELLTALTVVLVLIGIIGAVLTIIFLGGDSNGGKNQKAEAPLARTSPDTHVARRLDNRGTPVRARLAYREPALTRR